MRWAWTTISRRIRLYNTLLRLSRVRNDGGRERIISPPLVHAELAEHIGASRETVSREMSRGIDTDRVKQIVVSRTLDMLRDLGVTAVCEGVETAGELEVLRDLGVDLLQGYFIARPTFEGLSPISLAA